MAGGRRKPQVDNFCITSDQQLRENVKHPREESINLDGETDMVEGFVEFNAKARIEHEV